MKRLSKPALVVAAILAMAFAAVAKNEKAATFVDSGKAKFERVIPGVSKAAVWGNAEVGPYGAFTKFDPGYANPVHTHTNDVRIVVLRGAYVYKPVGGAEIRVGAGSFLHVPGGVPHLSGGDAKEGALFYEESPGKFDLVVVEKK